eukprot:CAMPEP_0116544224 /NCGR_PEP_ID=MMETSP0397-20121206/1997_1 /TAXON_ID=216820 /ORGANISM="Cyclophora tenuis, Strain ECT3854" /LENGTH=95 /DNA_ID=CAMNT_0004068409 /DNA_START=84 /DNA_END=371 /DNA_ORIENTATION=+
MTKLVDKVRTENQEMEEAKDALRREDLDNDPLLRLANFQGESIDKKAALVGAFLFSARSFGDVVVASIYGGDNYVIGAIVQGGIAILCAAYFFLF